MRDIRAVVGPEALVGVSTHSLAQARQAVLDGANYLGVGPKFPSTTKSFEQLPGLALLREVCAEIRLPAFAIGGISAGNLPAVLDAGFCRIAVSSAVVAAPSSSAAAQALRKQLWEFPQPAALPDSANGRLIRSGQHSLLRASNASCRVSRNILCCGGGRKKKSSRCARRRLSRR